MTTMLAALLVLAPQAKAQAPVEVPVPRPEPLLGMELGGGLSSYIISSHLQTGWARYLETVPATRLLNGIGSWTACQQLRQPEDAERILGTLHEYGIGVFRDEIGWGSTRYRDGLAQPMRLNGNAEAIYRAVLRAAKAHGFRLIVLLNAHQGMPCGARGTEGKFVHDGRQGDTRAALDISDPAAIRLGYSGLSNLTEYCAAEGLFTEVQPSAADGPQAFNVTLSKALPKDYPAGTKVPIHTLQYRPFGDPATEAETYQGWADYADLLVRIAAEEGVPDGQVGFEVWNELTFGTMFLSIENYDATLKGKADWDRMMQSAAEAVHRHFPAKAAVINGFSNTTFFFGGFWASARPEWVNGESYHPYGNQWREFPAFALDPGRKHLVEGFRNADGFVPRYGTLFPEYKGNYIDSHDLITLMQPEMREALVANGHAPAGWQRGMTEQGMFIPEVNAPEPFASRLRERPEHYVAKYWLRLYPFYLNKGLSFVCDGSLRNPGDWKDSWEARFAETGDVAYLKAMLPLQRMVRLLDGARDLQPDRPIQLRPRVWQLTGQDKVVFGTEGAYIVDKGAEGRPWDPAKAQPKPLTYRDVLCLLPFQVDDDTLAVGAYIQTRNILEDVSDAGRYRLTFPGLKADPKKVRAYDPLEDRAVPVEVSADTGTLSLTLTLTDCPVWIVLDGVDGPRGGGPVVATAQ